MSLDVYLRLQAAALGKAQPRAARRHVHLAPRPLVVVGYHLAGEPGAPVALRYGSTPTEHKLLVVDEPRDRTMRFARLATFAADLARWLSGFAARSEVDGEPVCLDAPQLVCPNPATAHWLSDTLGRSLRFLRPDGPHPVAPILPVAGAHLSFFGGRRALPGSSAVLTATEALTGHWCTGQLPAEDARLGTLLAWLDPSRYAPGADGPAAALVAEAQPPAGPESDPAWDRDVLAPLLGEYRHDRDAAGAAPAAAELAAACERALAPAWDDTWAALALLRALPEAGHVPQRWLDDRRAWTRHADRVASGTAHFRRTLDQLQSFRFLHELEQRTVALARQQALDDPLLLAARVAAGEALAGELVARDCGHKITSAKGRALVRPLLRLRPVTSCELPAGTGLRWVDNPAVTAEVVTVDGEGTVELMVVAGVRGRQSTAEETLPQPGARLAFLDAGDDRFPPMLPEQLPWTHEGDGEL